ncbi:MAG: hypothetical protein KIB00_11365 [Paeniclostridium sordellii]|uniref:hypothetical protein n=1 Tax=Paraclostridium sordellii TaxID=1505 RepID=UPI000C76A1AE|nr:hypothetical protein [Paeniclostridium sordellii]AUN14534.1 hypothetical protein RSJ16_10025 [Paeniclostridium sordellii]MBS6024671.1 hypothetical protein [Paeniclostridium sordellii]
MTGSKDVTEELELAMDKAVKNNKLLILSKGTYLVSGLEVPSNLKLNCLPGSKFKLVDNADKGTRCFSIASVSNVSIFGDLTVDGNQSNQHNKNEHMHGVFIYNSNNIYIDKINSYNAVGDNVSISGKDDSPNNYSYDIQINQINAKKAGRKNLVLEHVSNLNIDFAYLDNIEGGEDGNGGNSLDVEPFDFHGKIKMENTINYLYTVGCGNDFTAGTDEISNKYIVNINTFISKVFDLPCLVDANNQYNKSAIFSYGIVLNIDKMFVSLATTNSRLKDDTYTTAPNVINASHKATITINSLIVTGGVDNNPIFITSNGYTHSPDIKIHQLMINGNTSFLEDFIQ